MDYQDHLIATTVEMLVDRRGTLNPQYVKGLAKKIAPRNEQEQGWPQAITSS